MNDRPVRVGVLISGSGTTLANLVEQVRAGALRAEIAVVIASRACAGVDRAQAARLPCRVIPRREYESASAYSAVVFDQLRAAPVDLVVLGGFLSRLEIPDDFEHRVMNIHPALIPAFCGVGMHGRRVHEAVLARGCKVSGCTVHFCDNEYDHGPIILQRCVPVHDDDTPETLAARVFAVECETYPEAIRLFAAGRLRVVDHRVRTLPLEGL